MGELGELGEWESGRVGGVGEWELGEWVGGLGRAVFLFWFLGLAYASAGGLLYVAACSIWQPAHTKAVAEPPVLKARDGVGMEDIKHMQSRCDIFRCTGEIVKKKGGVPQCRVCFAKWVRDFASRHDADIALSSHPLPVPIGIVDGLVALLESSRIQGPVRVDLTREVLSLGAVHVRELGRTDWLGLNSQSRLHEMEQRRVLAAVGL